jgi:hypothetical protein
MKGQIPSRGGVEWFGDPLSDESAFIVSHSDTRPLELYRELMLVTALKNGAEDTVDLRLEIEMRGVSNAKPRERTVHDPHIVSARDP